MRRNAVHLFTERSTTKTTQHTRVFEIAIQHSIFSSRARRGGPEPGGEMTRYYVAAKFVAAAELPVPQTAPPHIHARHICADMWCVTYPHSGQLFVFRGRRGDLIKV